VKQKPDVHAGSFFPEAVVTFQGELMHKKIERKRELERRRRRREKRAKLRAKGLLPAAGEKDSSK
jgi:hypothetical protein